MKNIYVGFGAAVALGLVALFLVLGPNSEPDMAGTGEFEPYERTITVERASSLRCSDDREIQRTYRYEADQPLIFLAHGLSTQQQLDFADVALGCFDTQQSDSRVCDIATLRELAPTVAVFDSYREEAQSDWIDIFADGQRNIRACALFINSSEQPTTVTVTTQLVRR